MRKRCNREHNVFLTTFKTIYFWKINKIISFWFIDFFARNFVFTTSIFTIFTIFIFIFIFVSIDRILHIVVIMFHVKEFIKKKKFLWFFSNRTFEIFRFFRKEFLYVQIVESTLLIFVRKEFRNDFLTSFFLNVNATHEKNWNILDIFSKS